MEKLDEKQTCELMLAESHDGLVTAQNSLMRFKIIERLLQRQRIKGLKNDEMLSKVQQNIANTEKQIRALEQSVTDLTDFLKELK